MKIAVYEPTPRMCGPMAWAFQLRDGLRSLGHGADVVTCTKSGRPSAAWDGSGELKQSRGAGSWPVKPDRVLKFSESIAELNRYDLVILTDVASPKQDAEGRKTNTLPPYVHIVRSLTVPWASAMHGNEYTDKQTPWLRYLLEAPTATRVWPTCRLDGVATIKNDLLVSREWEFLHLPYALQRPDGEELPPAGTVGSTGRFIFNKGQPTLAMATKDLPDGTLCELWGASSVGVGPSPTYLTYETLVKEYCLGHEDEGAAYVRHGKGETGVGEPWSGGNIVAPYLWDLRFPGGKQVVRYLGVYGDSAGVCRRMAVHASLTLASFSRAAVEFATLEAMDAGCVPVITDNVAHPDYRTFDVPSPKSWSTPERQTRFPQIVTPVTEKVREALALTDEERQELVVHNRAAVARNNSPARVAGEVLRMAAL